jgi:hypothetical protein
MTAPVVRPGTADGVPVILTFSSGRALDVPDHHYVFVPTESGCQEGDPIDPETVPCRPRWTKSVGPGTRVIVDNKIEVVAAATSPLLARLNSTI